MLENFRLFEVADPFGRTWTVEFRWQQNAISIRHSDSVDCKYYLTSPGEPARELVVALRHPDLLALAKRRGREVTDAWVMKLASLHAAHMISTWEDMEKTLVTLTPADLERHNAALEEAAERERQFVR
jgi:hypothetical protein